MTGTTICILITIICYLIMMISIGAFFSKKNKSSDDFYLGGRHLGPLVAAMSAEASDMSSWLLLGLPGLALATGLAEASWTAIGLAIGTYINWLIVAKRLRIYTQKVGSFTIPDFFSRRFGDDKNILTAVAALFIVVFFVPYTASGFAACGKLFSSLFGIDYLTAMILSAVVIVIYCALGGFLAASTTDFVQSIIMTVALIVVVGFGISKAGSLGTAIDNVKAFDGYLDVFKGYDIGTSATGSYGFLPIVSTLAWGLGYFGMPHILLRFMAVEDKDKIALSRRVASVWVVISMGVAILIGVVGYSLMKDGIVPTYTNNSEAETLIIDVAKVISEHGVLTAIVGGIILAGILASTMSTSDSQLLAAASSISQNLVQEVFKVKISEKTSIVLARISVLAISVVAVFLAMDPNSSVFRIVSFAWGGFGAVFGPAVLFALFWKRSNKWGILTGMIAGGSMIFIWKFIIRTTFAGSALDIYELLPAFIVNCIFILVVSLITKAPSKEITDTFDQVAKEVR
ncbi:MAG: sodium/proline symporter PutP [Clostridiales bacterium]|nr:sodium/proline symporter PutP [Clostridiales bacterium]